jgi:DNA-binding SARP family transcriptional activator
MLVGDGQRAAGLLDDALRHTDGPAERTDVLCLRGRVAVLTGEQAAVLATLRAEADAICDQEQTLAGRLLLEAAILALYARDPDTVATAERAHQLAGDVDPFLRARAATVLGIAYCYNGQPDRGRPFLQHSVDLIRLGGSPQDVVHLLQQVVVGLAGLESYTEAVALCRQYAGAVRKVGATGVLPLVLGLLANAAYFTSDFDVMEMAATEALTLARSQQQHPLELFAHACLTLVLAVKGDTEAMREHAADALELIDSTGVNTFAPMTHLGLGLAELAAGSWSGASAQFGQVSAALKGLPTVSGALHWRAEEIEALWRAGEIDAARQLHRAMSDGLQNEGPWEHAAAARVGALLADPDDAEALFADALRWHQQSPSAFERARTELCFGEWLAGQGRREAASARLARAGRTFAELGARSWAARARTLLAELAVDVPPVPDAPDEDEPDGLDAPVQVRAFGPLTLVRGGVEIPVPMDTAGRALRSLVASGGSLHVEQLIDELWPDAPADQGAPRLRTVLSRTRARYGPVLVRDGSVIRWADGVSVDVQRFAELARDALSGTRDAASAAAAREAVRLYHGELLPLDRYSDWTVSARERLRQRYLALLEMLIDDAIERDELRTAIGYAREAVDAAPLDEDGYLRLGRLLLDAGQAGQARKVVARAKAAADELGLPPSAALLALDRRAHSADS